MADGSVVIEILGDASKFSSELSKVQGKASKAVGAIGDAMSGAGTAMTAGITAPLVAAGGAVAKWALQTASAAEQADIAFSTMLGPEKAKKMLDDLAQFAAHTPFEMAGLTSATQKLLAYGFSAEEVIPLLTSVGDATAGLGAGQEGIDAVTRALGQMQAKGKVMAEEMLQLTEVGIPAWQYLADAVSGGDIPAAMQMVTDGAVDAKTAIEALQDGMNRDFGGLMESQSKTLEGALSNLADAAGNAVRQLKDTDGYKQMASAIADLADSLGPLAEKAIPLADQGLQRLAGVVEDVASAMDGMDAGDIQQVVETLAGAAAAGPGLVVAGKGLTVLSKGMDLASGASGALSGVFGRLSEAVKLTAGGAGTLGESLSAMGFSISPVTAAVAGLVAVAGLAAAAFMDWQQKNENFTAATEGLRNVVTESTYIDDYADSIDVVGEKSQKAAMSVDELAESTARRVETMQQTTDAAQAEVAQLNAAQGIINEYAGKTDLATDAQGRLEWALALVNEQFGLNISQADVAAGKYTDQNGKVQDLTSSINNLIEAKKQEAKVEAITDNLTELYGAQIEAADTLAEAESTYAKAMKEAEKERGNLTDEQWAAVEANAAETSGLNSARAQFDAINESIDTCERALGETSIAAADATGAYAQLSGAMGSAKFELFSSQLDQAGTSFSALVDDLTALGVSTEDFASLTEDQLSQVASAYDGTTSSISGVLEELGVSTVELSGALAGTSGEIIETGSLIASAMGISLDQLSQKLTEAGISTQTLNSIGSANLMAMAANCGGSLEQLTWMIQNYNNVPIIDKNGNITANTTQLIDAQGRVWTWNGTTLVDQHGVAAVSATSLVDAQGKKYTWNGTQLLSQNGTAVVDYVEVTNAQGDKLTWNGTKLESQDGRAVIDDSELTDAQGNKVTWNGSNLENKSAVGDIDYSGIQRGIDLLNTWNSMSAYDKSASFTTTTTNRTVNITENRVEKSSRAAASPAAAPAIASAKAVPAAAASLGQASVPAPSVASQLASIPVMTFASSAADLLAPIAQQVADARAARAAAQAVDEVVSAQSRLDDKLGRKIDDGVRRIERKLDQPMRLDVNKREFGRLVREVS